MFERFSGPDWRYKEIRAAHQESMKTKDECITELKAINTHLRVELKQVALVFVELNAELMDRLMALVGKFAEYQMDRQEEGRTFGKMLAPNKEALTQDIVEQKMQDALAKVEAEIEERDRKEVAASIREGRLRPDV